MYTYRSLSFSKRPGHQAEATGYRHRLLESRSMSGKVQGRSKLNSRFHYLRGQSFLLAAVRCLEFVPGD